ncbi:lamin tail domain-containing protein [Pirellulales bacterium]|nr:lamin tail domain-containing protein [Pirellulales bacterium]
MIKNSRATGHRHRPLRFESLEPRYVLDSTVVFNELMYDPAGPTDATLEWVELYNQMSVNMDISGWRLEGGVDFAFPEGTIVPGHDYIVVAADPGALQSATGYVGAWGPLTGQLDNAGEEIRLVNRNDRRLSVLRYNDTDPWPVGADGAGFTLSKIGLNSAVEPAENWTVSLLPGGTPGAENFPPPGSSTFEEVLSEGEPATYLVPSDGSLGLTWTQESFVDSLWASGPTAIGFDTSGGLASEPPMNDLVFWLDAGDLDGDGVTTDNQPAGTSVRSWIDRIAGLRLLQFTISARPTLSTIGTQSIPSLSFDGNDFLEITDLAAASFLNDSQGAIAVVYSNTNGTEGYAFYSEGAGGQGPMAVVNDAGNVTNGAGGGFGIQVTAGGNNMILGGPPAVNDGQFHWSAVTANGNSWSFYTDGATPLPTGTVTGSNIGEWFDVTTSYSRLGVGAYAPGGNPCCSGWEGDIAEMMIFDKVLTPSELGQLNDYIFGKYEGTANSLVTTDIESEMHGVNSAAFIRSDFQVTDVPAIDSMELSITYNDGFVAYINGQEVASRNAPASPAWNSSATQEVTGVVTESIPISPAGVLQEGNNTLAILGLNRTSGDEDFLILPELTLERLPPSAIAVVLGINEVPAASGSNFWVEIANEGSSAVQLGGYVLESSAHGDYVFPSQSIAAGDQLLINQAMLGFGAADNDKLNLYGPGKTRLLDARRVTTRLRGRSDQFDERWLYPDVATPGSANSFTFTDDVVINEIMYHAMPVLTDDAEEWIELYNKGNSTVDLTGFTIRGGVDFDIPAGTTIAPGEYLVVAHDAADMAAAYPGINVIGNFSGRLNNHDDRIRLRDPLDNPADEVHYYEGGRWPDLPDGNGSSLELRDPDADNSRAESWAASDETGNASWQTYTFRGTAAADAGPTGVWNEFLFGMLRAGEVLIDDVSVIASPDAAATQLIQNGSFEGDSVGGPGNKWRIVGNHHGAVIVDPDNGANQVLHLKATGHTHHEHNNAGTTFVGNTQVVNGREYEISFRAKWLSGSNQLLSRLYLSRVALTTLLEVPERAGTPGAANSTFEANVGPTYDGFRHGPVVPEPLQGVTVSVAAEDPDGVNTMTLWWSVDGGPQSSTSMTLDSEGRYQGVIPGQSAGTVVQFFVEGEDNLGATSTFPAGGADSRALFEVEDGRGTDNPIDTIRTIMLTADINGLVAPTNALSNQFTGATVVVNDQEVYYDVGVHLKGASRARFSPLYWGSYTIRFQPDRLFRGVHEKIGLDASGPGQDEIMLEQIFNHAGGQISVYSDLAYSISPFAQHTGPVIVELAKYGDVFFDNAFQNGEDGTVFEYSLVYYPTQTVDGNPESLKLIEPNLVIGQSLPDMGNMGDDKENYRWNFLIKNNRAADDYSRVIAMSQTFSRSGSAFLDAVDEVIDVDQWLRMNAIGNLTGITAYFSSSAQNTGFYVRPEDNRVLMLPWDSDSSFGVATNAGLVANNDLAKLLGSPEYRHFYYGHLLDIIDTSFNADYVTYWADHYGGLVDQNFSANTSYVQARANSVSSQVVSAVPMVGFQISTSGPLDVGNAPTATLTGQGWIDVRELRLAGSGVPLETTWNTVTGWEVIVPVDSGNPLVTIEAYDFQGNLIGTDTITVNTTFTGQPLKDFLQITELMYHPSDPTNDEIAAGFTDDDAFEYIEFYNSSLTQTLDLTGVQIADGPAEPFHFSNSLITSLGPDEYLLVVRDQAGFEARYGATLSHLIAGEYIGGFSNTGEAVQVVTPTGQDIHSFTYADLPPWPTAPDGGGPSLQLVDPFSNPDHSLAETWTSSVSPNGSPGGPDTAIGDYNQDGVVDGGDLNLWESEFGTLAGATADGDEDGDADGNDFLLWQRNVIQAPASAALAAGTQSSPLPPATGDFDADGKVDATDIDVLFSQIPSAVPPVNERYNLVDDDVSDHRDRRVASSEDVTLDRDSEHREDYARNLSLAETAGRRRRLDHDRQPHRSLEANAIDAVMLQEAGDWNSPSVADDLDSQ